MTKVSLAETLIYIAVLLLSRAIVCAGLIILYSKFEYVLTESKHRMQSTLTKQNIFLSAAHISDKIEKFYY